MKTQIYGINEDLLIYNLTVNVSNEKVKDKLESKKNRARLNWNCSCIWFSLLSAIQRNLDEDDEDDDSNFFKNLVIKI